MNFMHFIFDVSNMVTLIFQAVDVLRVDYEPSDLDILYAEGVTSSNGLSCVDFSFPQPDSDEDIDPADRHDHLLRLVPGVIEYDVQWFSCMCVYIIHMPGIGFI